MYNAQSGRSSFALQNRCAGGGRDDEVVFSSSLLMVFELVFQLETSKLSNKRLIRVGFERKILNTMDPNAIHCATLSMVTPGLVNYLN